MKQRVLNILIALDQLIYVLVTLGKGMPDETMSSAAWRGEQLGHPLPRFFRPVIDALFHPLEKDHCYKAYLSERMRSQIPESY